MGLQEFEMSTCMGEKEEGDEGMATRLYCFRHLFLCFVFVHHDTGLKKYDAIEQANKYQHDIPP